MTRTQQLIWTPLPNGSTSDRKRLRLSVLVSPRLVTDGGADEPLKAFPDFIDWADRVGQAKFVVRFAGLAVEATIEVPPEQAVYAKLFGKATTVRSHTFEDKTSTAVLTSPTVALGADLAQIYGDMSAAAHDDYPSRLDWTRSIGKLAKGEELSLDVVLRMLRDARKPHEGQQAQLLGSSIVGRFAIHDAYNSPLSAREMKDFHPTRPDDRREDVSWQTNRTVPLPKPDSFRDIIDFHRIVGLLSQHPNILRASGFRVDLILRREDFPQSATDRLTIEPHWPQGSEVRTLPDSAPGIQTVLAHDQFAPAPRAPADPLAIDGFVKLGDTSGLLQVDVNGSVLKLRQFATNIANTDRRDLENFQRLQFRQSKLTG